MDASGIERLDSTGAWLLLRTRRALEAAGRKVSALKVPDRYVSLLENLDRDDKTEGPVKRGPRMGAWQYRLYRIGKATMDAGRQGWRMLGYLGRVTVETGEMIAAPRKNLRFAAMVHQVEETGISALPIVGLLAFLIGVVLAYQGADQLKRFGAEIFTINLLGVGVLREIGGLITAIIVAGRSGSAFTAQIGHHARQPGNRRHADHGPQHRRYAGAAAHHRAGDRAAASDLLRQHHGPDRRRGDVLFRSRHHHSGLSCASSTKR